MAKAPGHPVPAARETRPRKDGELLELAAKLEDLAWAQEDVRSAVSDDEPDHTFALDRLFAAVARLNPLHAAGEIRARAGGWGERLS